MKKIFFTIFQTIGTSAQRPKSTLVFLLAGFLLLFFSLGMMAGTHAQMRQARTGSDRAAAARFDVEIIAPEDFAVESDKSTMEYRFLSDADERRLFFRLHNHSEVDILCTPGMTNAEGILWQLYVAEEACTSFVAAAGEAVDFLLVITPDGIGTAWEEMVLTVDSRQWKGV